MTNSSSNPDSRQTPNTKAPTEKHLEDWIVANPWCLNQYTDTPVDPLFRQFRLASGIPDIIALCGGNLYVIELKKNEVNSKTIIQLMRYVAELREVWQYALEYLPSLIPNDFHTYSTMLVHGIAIGDSCDQSIVDLAMAANISVSTYEYDGEGYEITDCLWGYDRYHLRNIARGEIGRAMRWAYMTAHGDLFPDLDIANLEEYWQSCSKSEDGAE